jgi:hypothetical protein
MSEFTVEAVFRPDAGGQFEQRFFHTQEVASENRVMLELRLVGSKWYMDTYIRSGGSARALHEAALTHPVNRRQTAALAFDGRNMIQYVNGVKELSAGIRFAPHGKGKTSIGARFGKVSWFKGAIREIRISPKALTPAGLLKPGHQHAPC